MEKFIPVQFDAEIGKKTIKLLASKAVEDIMENGQDVLLIADNMAKLENFMKEVRGDQRYTELLLEELAKHGGGKHELPNGTKIEQAELGTKYDYATCNDPQWETLAEEKMQIDAALEERQEFLKRIPAKGEKIVDEATGEVRIIYPPAKRSTTGYKITIPNR